MDENRRIMYRYYAVLSQRLDDGHITEDEYGFMLDKLEEWIGASHWIQDQIAYELSLRGQIHSLINTLKSILRLLRDKLRGNKQYTNSRT